MTSKQWKCRSFQLFHAFDQALRRLWSSEKRLVVTNCMCLGRRHIELFIDSVHNLYLVSLRPKRSWTQLKFLSFGHVQREKLGTKADYWARTAEKRTVHSRTASNAFSSGTFKRTIFFWIPERVANGSRTPFERSRVWLPKEFFRHSAEP